MISPAALPLTRDTVDNHSLADWREFERRRGELIARFAVLQFRAQLEGPGGWTDNKVALLNLLVDSFHALEASSLRWQRKD